MEIDDSNGKVRRNLLIFSFAIVISTFLNLSIQKQSKAFSSIDLASISPLKFWIVITFVLIYLFYRYWFDNQTNEAIALFKTEFQSHQFSYIKRLLNNDIANSILKNKKTKFFNNFEELEEPRIVELNRQYGKPVSVDSNAAPRFVEDSMWRGSVGHSYSIKWNGNSYAKSGGFGSEFNIPLLEKYYLQLKVLFTIKSIIYN